MVTYITNRFPNATIVQVLSNAVLFDEPTLGYVYLQKDYMVPGTFFLETAMGEFSKVIESGIVISVSGNSPTGNFMNMQLVVDYFNASSITPCEGFWEDNLVMYDKCWMRTQDVARQMSAQAFREMECIVPTWFKTH